MKKFFIMTILGTILFLNGCTNNFSNLDIQKLNQKAAEYMQAGEYEKAIARLESILDLNPDYPQTHFNLGVAYYQINDYEKALEALNKAIEKENKLADAFYTRAVVYEDWAYSILEGENSENGTNNNDVSTEDKNKSLEYLKNAKNDFEKYLELNKDAKDADEVHEKIIQIENDINNSIQ